MNIILIGTGNVATVLGEQFTRAGHRIVQVFGRTEASARELSGKLESAYTCSWKELIPEADLYVVAISDSAITGIPQHIRLKDQLIVHTAGAVPAEVLQPVSGHYGVLYPLQSLRGQAPSTGQVPFLIDANTEGGLKKLKTLVRSIHSPFQVSNDEQRLQMHLAAVWVNNFPNLLYSIAFKICLEKELDFRLLKPLIAETAERISIHDPREWQTGPAIRKDQNTLEKHKALLVNHPNWLQLYSMLSEEIQRMA
jgi:predicted short-subunit dehydrogenase-like oxidoreductase (DUF2520 family)